MKIPDLARPSLACGLQCLLVGCAASCLAADVDFARQVRPILTRSCFRCHGPDEETLEAGLRLDQGAAATAELDSGSRAIVPGEPDESELLARVSDPDDDSRMPPRDAGARLTPAEIEVLRRWIASGANYAPHWSFVKPKPPEVPRELSDPSWVRNPIDALVLQRLDREGWKPNPEADRPTLARRLSLDLTGLPPTPDAVDRFIEDGDPEAYERFVDRLLDSPAYGERWARVWLDLARYADSAGYAQDPPRTIWRYRDWVIQAIRDNLPFDQFTIEQLAGDLLPAATESQLLATAFHRNTMTNSEGGTDDEEFRCAAVVDRVNTTMQVWMGLTMGCAQCHSHKYDPITQEEYFRVYAIFNNTEDADRGDEAPNLVTFTAEQREQQAALQEEIDQLHAPPDADALPEEGRRQLEELKKRFAAIQGVSTPILRELPADRRRTTQIHVRGNFRNPGPQVSPGVPAAFHPLSGEGESSRLDFARWLVAAENPLTARVTANRYWEQLFGVGLVETSEDFGLQGEPPSHPELLDYLATELVRLGWDTRQLLRTIVTSATYRQSSRMDAATANRDPQNRWLARGPAFRLSAEAIRDQALAASGLLSVKMWGPSVQPPQPNLGFRSAFGGSTDWTTSPGEDRYRRGLYTSWRRTTPYPSLIAFDAPSREFCTLRRIRTNTPLQALITLNDPVYVEAAQALARRVVAQGGSTVEDRAVHAFRLCLARRPSAAERLRVAALFEQAEGLYRESPEPARAMAADPLGALPEGADAAELAAWTVVGNVLMNLDEFLNKR